MNPTNAHNQRIAKMTFASVYPMYLAKVEKKGRTKEELHQVLEWLTGFNNQNLQDQIEKKNNIRILLSTGNIESQCPPHNRDDMWLPY